MLDAVNYFAVCFWACIVLYSIIVGSENAVLAWIIALLAFFKSAFLVGVPLAALGLFLGGKELGQSFGQIGVSISIVYASAQVFRCLSEKPNSGGKT